MQTTMTYRAQATQVRGDIVMRGYQRTAVNEVMRLWRFGGIMAVLLVSPTGSGKTIMLEEICNRARASNARILWVCHRDSLVAQAVEELERRHPGEIGVIHPDYAPAPDMPIQVATVQSLLARGDFPVVHMVVLDEAHHYVADEWSQVARHYRGVRVIGATATPERSDGRPLGDIFQEMVVAEKYSTLIAQKHLLDARYWVPTVERGGMAMSPVDAWFKFGEGQSGFVYVGGVDQAKKVTKEFNERGVPAACIVATTPTDERRKIISDMKVGLVKLIVNVYTMTEGVNITNANLCIMARGCGSVATFVQMVGRVLRPDGDTKYAIVVALNSNVLAHGFPTEDREYSLHGECGVARAKSADSLRQCQKCGFVWEGTKGPQCPECGWIMPIKNLEPRIYNGQLKEVYKGDETGDDFKEMEFLRLRGVANNRSYSMSWVVRQYKRLFPASAVPKGGFTQVELVTYYAELKGIAERKGYKSGWARGCFYSTVGKWPPRGQ